MAWNTGEYSEDIFLFSPCSNVGSWYGWISMPYMSSNSWLAKVTQLSSELIATATTANYAWQIVGDINATINIPTVMLPLLQIT